MTNQLAAFFSNLINQLFNHPWLSFGVAFIIVFRKPLGKFLERLVHIKISRTKDGNIDVEAHADSEPRSIEDTHPNVATPVEEEKDELEAEQEPESSGNYFFDLFDAFTAGDFEKAEQIYKANQAEVQDEDDRYKDHVVYLYMRFRDGKDDSAIRQLEEEVAHPESPRKLVAAVRMLQLAYADMQDYAGIERVVSNALKQINDERDVTLLTRFLAKAYGEQGDCPRGIRLLEARLKLITNAEDLADIYFLISELEEKQGNIDVAALAFEKGIMMNPHDRKKLFDAAYLQGKSNLKLLSLKNYERLLSIDSRHPSALNNIAVALQNLGLKGKSISFYQKSINENQSLAKANMAIQLTDAGFYDEAQKILDAAMKDEDPHENIAKAASHLEKTRNSEDKKWDEIIQKSTVYQTNVREYADAYFDTAAVAEDFYGTWYTKSGEEVVVEENGDGKLTATWTSPTKNPYTNKEDITSIAGDIRHRSASVTYEYTPSSTGGLLALAGNQKISCLSYLSHDKQSWTIFSNESEKELLLVLTKAPPNEK